jgi:hypothetical protein
MAELSDEALATMIARYEVTPTPHLAINLEHVGGAASRVAVDATAFSERDALYDLIVTGCWTDPAETKANIAWIRETWQALRPFSKPSVYANYLDAGDETRTADAYGPNYGRLAEIKAKYDPENLFRNNQNIVPAK